MGPSSLVSMRQAAPAFSTTQHFLENLILVLGKLSRPLGLWFKLPLLLRSLGQVPGLRDIIIQAVAEMVVTTVINDLGPRLPVFSQNFKDPFIYDTLFQ